MRVVFHTSAHASPQSICMTAAAPDDVAFAHRHLASVLADASASLPANRERVSLPLPYVIFQALATLLAVVQLAGGTAATLDCACWPAVDASCSADATRGVGLGLLGGALVRGAEAWRTAGDDDDGGGDGELSDAVEREYCLTNSVLTATTPLALLSRVVTGDAAVGERAVQRVLASPQGAAALHVAGTTAASAWSHGVLQQATALALTDAALRTAMVAMPAEPDATWWWPLVASGTAIAPVAAAVLAAAATAAADRAVAPLLRPAVTAEAHAREEAVAVATERSLRRFALQAPPEVAERRHRAFVAAAGAWLVARRRRDAREGAASAARALVAASVYAASGGSQLAPVIAGVLGGSDSVVAWLRGGGGSEAAGLGGRGLEGRGPE